MICNQIASGYKGVSSLCRGIMHPIGNFNSHLPNRTVTFFHYVLGKINYIPLFVIEVCVVLRCYHVSVRNEILKARLLKVTCNELIGLNFNLLAKRLNHESTCCYIGLYSIYTHSSKKKRKKRKKNIANEFLNVGVKPF